ncbi:hypothetical protein HPB50_004572 [Hyalomma asiaticum]|uniref:Uncharacterized protein n=1 Tax=Hyalomma asiaticum TaxID=266040 RepID=A0ACB7SRA4_HYAAI|nr:hypothetical protein HPB50_004572 [Hyalomma asiaticum]
MLGNSSESRSSSSASLRDAHRSLHDVCIRHSKSDPVLVTLSHNSPLPRCSEQDSCWDSIEDLAQQHLLAQGADAVTLEGLKNHYNSCFTIRSAWPGTTDDDVVLSLVSKGKLEKRSSDAWLT